jgi:hypothetical protein
VSEPGFSKKTRAGERGDVDKERCPEVDVLGKPSTSSRQDFVEPMRKSVAKRTSVVLLL